jgi:hypothetical protein
MRVSRRTRPSQVGCGASVARRRLLHAQASDSSATPESLDQFSIADLSMVIELDRYGARNTPAEPAQQNRSDQRQKQVPVVAGSSARGW